jgi:hypothetical protein
MAIREFVYKITPPARETVDSVRDRLVPAAESMLVNQWIAGVELELYEDHLLLFLTMVGHDRWWIKRRAPYLVVAILTRAGLHARDARIMEVRSLASLKNARFWTEGHSRGQRVHKPADGTETPSRRTGGCKGCKQPFQLVEKRSGWHQTYQGSGR